MLNIKEVCKAATHKYLLFLNFKNNRFCVKVKLLRSKNPNAKQYSECCVGQLDG